MPNYTWDGRLHDIAWSSEQERWLLLMQESPHGGCTTGCRNSQVWRVVKVFESKKDAVEYAIRWELRRRNRKGRVRSFADMQ